MADGANMEAVQAVDNNDTGIKTPEVVVPDLNEQLKIQIGEYVKRTFQEKGGDLGGLNSLDAATSIYLKGIVDKNVSAKKQVESNLGEYVGTPTQTPGEQVLLVEIKLPVTQELRPKIAERKKPLPLEPKLMKDKNFPLFYSSLNGAGYIFGANDKNSEVMITGVPIYDTDTSVNVYMTQENFKKLAVSVGFK